ncbi:hypothetical protein CDL15_Pgr028285 [Punica granatum]|uniref:Uncharacterized protein n=1 Tax=Punica granatum TaxID=22663 RepID=A0A218X1R6_PUNGR|nr:hypothetical protein CDL15_Pgr028285 [Punica granatum]
MTPGVARARLRLQTEQFASAGTSEMPPGIDLHFCLPYTLAFTTLGTSGPRTSCPHLLLFTGFGLAFTALGTSGPRTSCPHFTAFHSLHFSIYYFRDFGSPDFVSAFTAFHGLRPSIYCFRDFGSPDFVSTFTAFHRLRPSIYCFRDFGSPDFVSAFTAFHRLRPSIYCFRDFGSPDFVSAFTAFHGLRPSIYCFRDFGSPDFVSAFIAFRISRPLYCFLRALAPHLPLHILQISIRLLSYDRRGELPRRVTTEAVAGTKRVASHDLWLPPLIEHATKEGQAVSTPFWSTDSNRGLPTKARNAIHLRENQGQIGDHRAVSDGRETWSNEKTGKSNQKGKQTTNLEATGAGTAALFIIESPKHREVSNMGL